METELTPLISSNTQQYASENNTRNIPSANEVFIHHKNYITKCERIVDNIDNYIESLVALIKNDFLRYYNDLIKINNENVLEHTLFEKPRFIKYHRSFPYFNIVNYGVGASRYNVTDKNLRDRIVSRLKSEFYDYDVYFRIGGKDCLERLLDPQYDLVICWSKATQPIDSIEPMDVKKMN